MGTSPLQAHEELDGTGKPCRRLFRVGSRDALIIIYQSSGYYARFWTQEVSNQSSNLMRFHELAHGLFCLGFGQPIFASAMKFLLRGALTRRVHPAGEYSVAADTIGRVQHWRHSWSV